MVGFAKVRKLKDGDLPFEQHLFLPSSSTSGNGLVVTDEEVLKRARHIAIGRKAKQLKRKLPGMKGSAAKILKVRESDRAGLHVSDAEVKVVVEELSRPAEDDTKINLPLCTNNKEMYVEFDSLAVPLPNTREFRICGMVFHDLWRRGFYLTTGIRFGCHYLAYEGVPGEVHAKFLVACLDSDENLSPMRLISLSRVGTQVKKTVLLAFVSNDNHIPHYMSLQWWKPGA